MATPPQPEPNPKPSPQQKQPNQQPKQSNQQPKQQQPKQQQPKGQQSQQEKSQPQQPGNNPKHKFGQPLPEATTQTTSNDPSTSPQTPSTPQRFSQTSIGRDSVQVSKFMSLVLRHKPEAAKLTLDANGWANVQELLTAINDKYPHPRSQPFTFDDMAKVVASCAKQRFLMSEDKTKIRANQGHSLKTVDLEFKPIVLEQGLQLYHGTSTRAIASIAKVGLTKQTRQHVHFSSDLETALAVGKRHGKPIILVVDMDQLRRDNLLVYRSENGVHLMDELPAKYLKFQDGTDLASA